MQRTTFFLNTLPKDTISYKYIYEELVKKRELPHIIVIGCTIENSIFEDVNFHLSDFDGTMLIKCKFVIGDWSRTDCCSLTVAKSVFKGIDFSLSTMRNCDFNQCEFINCNFDHIALSGSRFTGCIFRKINLTQSSTYLNIYERCTFEKCSINGNFYYNMLIHNTYNDTSFNQKLLAYNYFLLNEGTELATIGFGNAQKEALEDYLLKNNLLINYVILGLNEANDVDMSFIQFIIAFGQILKIGLLLREEQLQFVQNFLIFILKNNLISVITIVESLSCLEKDIAYFESQDFTAYKKCKESLNLIKNELYHAYQVMGSSITYSKDAIKKDKEHIVKLVYNEEPQIPICSIINDIKMSLGIDAPDAIRIKTEKGSFHEWISCYDSVLQCLQLFIAVLGLGYNIMSGHKKHEKENAEKEEVPKENLLDTTSSQMIDILNKAISKQKINPEFSQAIKIVVKNEVIATKKFRGYSRANVQSVDIITKKN